MYHCNLLSDYLQLRSTQTQQGLRRGLEELRFIKELEESLRIYEILMGVHRKEDDGVGGRTASKESSFK